MNEQHSQIIKDIISKSESILIPVQEINAYREIGTIIAFGLLLQALGKRVSIVCADYSLVQLVSFLDTSLVTSVIDTALESVLSIDISDYPIDSLQYDSDQSRLRIYINSQQKKLKPELIQIEKPRYQYDLVLTLNLPNWALLGPLFDQYSPIWLELPSLALSVLPILHPYSEHTLIDTQSESLAESILAYTEKEHKHLLSLPIAEALMTSLIVQSNTSQSALRSILALQDWGVNYSQLLAKIRNALHFNQLKLLGYILVNLKWNEVHLSGQAIHYVSSKLFTHNFQKTQTTEKDIAYIIKVLPAYLPTNCLGIHILVDTGKSTKSGYVAFADSYNCLAELSSRLNGIYSQGALVYSYPTQKDIALTEREIHKMIKDVFSQA